MTTSGCPPLRLYLVRHGETPWSVSGQHTGRTDIALTTGGEDEATALRPWLRDVEFSHVLTSPLQRARRTAELAAPGHVAETEPDLAEWDYGDYEGQLSSAIQERRAGWSVWRDGCPGGEMPDQVSGRADRLISHLRTLEGSVALFTHGQFASVLGARWIGLPVADARHLSLGTASLSVLGDNPSHPGTAVIALWNATPAALRGSYMAEFVSPT